MKISADCELLSSPERVGISCLLLNQKRIGLSVLRGGGGEKPCVAPVASFSFSSAGDLGGERSLRPQKKKKNRKARSRAGPEEFLHTPFSFPFLPPPSPGCLGGGRITKSASGERRWIPAFPCHQGCLSLSAWGWGWGNPYLTHNPFPAPAGNTT